MHHSNTYPNYNQIHHWHHVPYHGCFYHNNLHLVRSTLTHMRSIQCTIMYKALTIIVKVIIVTIGPLLMLSMIKMIIELCKVQRIIIVTNVKLNYHLEKTTTTNN